MGFSSQKKPYIYALILIYILILIDFLYLSSNTSTVKVIARFFGG